MQSVTPPYLDKQRQRLKRSRLFVDATYAGKPLRAQKQQMDVVKLVGGQEVLTPEVTGIVDWTDLDNEPIEGDVMRFVTPDEAWAVESYAVLPDGFCRLILRRR